jgi:hypothetical protein
MYINSTPPTSTLLRLKSRPQYVKPINKVKLTPKQYQSYLSSPSPAKHIKANPVKKETTSFIPPGFLMGVIAGAFLILIL